MDSSWTSNSIRSSSSSGSSLRDSDEENGEKSSPSVSSSDGDSTPRKVLKDSNSSNLKVASGSNSGDIIVNAEEKDPNANFKENEEAEKKVDQGQNQNQSLLGRTTEVLNLNQTGRGNRDRLPVKLSTFREISDLTKLDCITLDHVLECLRERYRCHQYYTYAGPILLSLNSCLRLPRASLIEDVARMSWYFVNVSNKSGEKGQEGGDVEERSPHVYDIGRRSLKNLVNVGSHQIILISGETGAGKTTATQQLIKYLTENNSRNFGANVCSNLDKKIYFATVILESFGNARTQSNPNSSRFGRLVQLNYNKHSGQITGAEIQTYLLEKHRVSKYEVGYERTFHIFYYILHCLRSGTIEMPNLSWKAMRGVTPEHMLLEASECDEDEVQRLQNAVVAFNMDDFSEVVNVLFAIISLLSVTFVPDCDSSSEEEHFSSSLESPYKTEFTVSDWNCARLAADLLGINDNELVDILIARKITAGNTRRHSIFRKPCERSSECEERLHALTSFIYDRIFSYVLDHLNENLKGEAGQNVDDCSTLSLLDLYGFENFSVNHLEQICINYANERLQQINISIMKSYYEQSIPPDEVMIPPTELIRIEKELHGRIDELHLHVFAFFDEECLLKRSTEERDVLERLRMNLQTRKAKFVQAGRPHETTYKFTVAHYATSVEYQMKGLVQKNKDHIPPEFQDILKSSDNAFIQNLFQVDLIRSRNSSGQTPKSKSVFTISNNKNSRGKTILTRFKVSVDDLMSRLKAGENKDVHFIRCIRPNADLLAGTFSMSIVEKQLHTCGIADVVKIAGNGFPIRIHTAKFAAEFPKVTTYYCGRIINSKLLTLIFSGSGCPTSIKFGKTMIFMSEECWKRLKKTEKFLTLHHARVIQVAWKNFLVYREELRKLSLPSLTKSFEDPSSEDVVEMSDVSSNTFDSVNSVIDRSNVTLNCQIDTSDGSTLTSTPSVLSRLRMKSRSTRPPLYFGNGIASRTPVHTLPIKVYTKKTCLPFAEKAPRRLLANGIQDAFEDYGITLYKT